MPCHRIIDDNEIKQIYDGCHVMVADYKITTKCQSADKKEVSVELYDLSKNKVNSSIYRYYLDNEPLVGRAANGKVAEHSLFILEDKYKKRGIGSSVHDNECKIYKRNGFAQIHTTAVCDGLIFWPRKKGFLFKHENEEAKIVGLWKAFVADSNGLQKTGKDALDIIKNVNRLKDIDDKYLRSKSGSFQDFTEWVVTSGYSLNVKLYKNL